ncbi:hypothetical protein EV363DRAFT_1400470 [Boletus edulis]|uniref:Uncharacterized protein n=1 Tax=Boletus edulis BED1 TaxID=1328754 RepID=A0AAD4G5J1_BOLED|nr:hypothetical protein EV363DRAFT_1400470 [Boletus edulis]KAF8415060.1 hypothetical protein L210DRAFT_938813 [Boletus edulis BED1]
MTLSALMHSALMHQPAVACSAATALTTYAAVMHQTPDFSLMHHSVWRRELKR